MPETDVSARNKKNYIRAAYAPDGPSADGMIRLLNENGIDAFRQGGVKDIYKIGGDIFGEEIMVDPEDLAEAQALFKQYPGTAPLPDPKPRSLKKTFLSLIAAVILFCMLLFLRSRISV